MHIFWVTTVSGHRELGEDQKDVRVCLRTPFDLKSVRFLRALADLFFCPLVFFVKSDFDEIVDTVAATQTGTDDFCTPPQKKTSVAPTFATFLISLFDRNVIGASGRKGGYCMMSSEGNDLTHSAPQMTPER